MKVVNRTVVSSILTAVLINEIITVDLLQLHVTIGS